MSWELPDWAKQDEQELQTFGLMPQVPYIRASDYETASQDEFLYYLKRRLGITPAISYSTTLNRGTWFHAFAAKEFDGSAPEPPDLLVKRKHELAHLLQQGGSSAGFIERQVGYEEVDYQMARAWWTAAISTPIGQHGTIPEILGRFRVIGSEVGLRTTIPGVPVGVLAGRVDLLLLDPRSNHLWVVDWKTAAAATEDRLSTCLYEFQTNHYLTILSLLLRKPVFRRKFHLPADTQMGGMLHFAFQKPSIKLSGNDRDYEVDTTKPNAPRKYYGEPKFENYLRRVQDWVNGSGEYEGRETNNPVNFSQVDAGLLLDKRRMYRYQSDLNWMLDLALRPANPYLFRSNVNSTRDYGSLSEWAPFYFTNVWEWPAVIKAGNFLIGHRDAEEQYASEFVPTAATSSARRGYKRLTASGRSRLSNGHKPLLTRFAQEVSRPAAKAEASLVALAAATGEEAPQAADAG